MRLIIALVLVYFATAPIAGAQSDSSLLPAWYQAHIGFMTRDSGAWIAENHDVSDQNPYTHFGLQWTAMPGNTGMTGRLYGLRADGSTEEFWQFREFWHAGDNQARVMQWGLGGAFGDGVMTRYGDDFATIRQTFSWPNGVRTEGGHIIRTGADNTYTAEQYRINPDTGQWEFQHALTFRRQE